ncbi:MAG: hypothetical protein IJI98_09100 [Methanosphaera sp.]|nr:hypothetical protein [Methanosphaera sp.]
MITWKHLFNQKILEKSKNYKGKISEIKHTPSTITAQLKTNREFKVELVIEENQLFDLNCTCSSKTHCIHQAVFLRFIEEFPEILEDHQKYYKPQESVLNKDCEQMLKQVSITRLNTFIKKELKLNPQFKYDFIKYFQNKSLIDEKLYEKNLNTIFYNAKGQGFSYHGYYEMGSLSKPLKKYMRTDIKKLIEAKEYKLACKLLNNIMEKLDDEIYIDDRRFYDIVYYYQDYADILLEQNINDKDKNKIKKYLIHFYEFGF